VTVCVVHAKNSGGALVTARTSNVTSSGFFPVLSGLAFEVLLSAAIDRGGEQGGGAGG